MKAIQGMKRKGSLAALTLSALISAGAGVASAQVEQCDPANLASCVELNMGGSSAGTLYATTVPLVMLDTTPAPIHYVNGVISVPTTPTATTITANKLHVWSGMRAGVRTIIRYAATGSSDGVNRPSNYTAAPGAGINLGAGEMHFLDHNAGGCDPFVSKTKGIDVNNDGTIGAGETFTFFEKIGCTGIVKQQVELGASDVHGGSFHQTGGGVVKPLNQSQLDSVQAVIVPFKFVLGKDVKKRNPVTGALENVGTLSRLEIEWLLSTSAASGNFKWSTLGLWYDENNNGLADDAQGASEKNIVRCMRAAGSGTKAALDETVMKDANETPLGTTDLLSLTPTNSSYFGKSTQDVQDCIAGRDMNENGGAFQAGIDRPHHPNAIGYLDADASIPDSPWDLKPGVPGGYDVAINGLHANDPDLPGGNAKLNIICGKYPYWVGWRLNSHLNLATFAGVTPAMVALKNAFVTAATVTGVNDFWVKLDEMHVFKNEDKGPVTWKTAHVHPAGKDHPPCGYNPPDPKLLG